jgi:hypothetical protein
VTGTTYLHPAFALGSANRGDLWNQRRALLAHWGTPEKPAYLQVRLLRDGYDFSPGQIFVVQKEGRALAAINLGTDTGDTHISLDRIKDATVKAKDIRLRFEFGGAAGDLEIATPSKLTDPLRISAGKLHIELGAVYARWGEATGRWACGKEKGRAVAEVVLFETNEPQSVRLDQLSTAALGLWMHLSDSPQDAGCGVKAEERDGRLFLTWGELKLNVPVKPAKARQQQMAVERAELERDPGL